VLVVESDASSGITWDYVKIWKEAVRPADPNFLPKRQRKLMNILL
jgi:hypothetical protein